jgi:hypothetical protein
MVLNAIALSVLLAAPPQAPQRDYAKTWNSVESAIRSRFYARTTRKDELDRLLAEAKPKASAARNEEEFSAAVNVMIDGFKDSRPIVVIFGSLSGSRPEDFPICSGNSHCNPHANANQTQLKQSLGSSLNERFAEAGNISRPPLQVLACSICKSSGRQVNHQSCHPKISFPPSFYPDPSNEYSQYSEASHPKKTSSPDVGHTMPNAFPWWYRVGGS